VVQRTDERTQVSSALWDFRLNPLRVIHQGLL